MAVKIFFCYAREDEELLNKLKAHLKPLQRKGLIDVWYDRDISAGAEWEQVISQHLNSAQIILLLVSPDFMASDYINDVELKRAIERHHSGEARVIPIILRYSYWQGETLGRLQPLPTDSNPVMSQRWYNLDEALNDVAEGIRKAIEELTNNSEAVLQAKSSITETPRKTLEQWLDRGEIYFDQEDFESALAAYEQAIRLDPNNAFAHFRKGHALRRLDRLYEALPAHEQAIHLDPNNNEFYYHKGRLLDAMELYEEALVAYEQAIHLAPNFARDYNFKGLTLYHLKRYKEALAAFEQGISLAPNYPYIYNNKGVMLQHLKRYEKAVDAFDKAIRIDPTDASAYHGKGLALFSLKRYEEAVAAFDQAIFFHSNYADAYKNKGLALIGLGKLEEANQAFKRAQQLRN